MITTTLLPMSEMTREQYTRLPAGLFALALVETVTELEDGRKEQFLIYKKDYGLRFILEGDARERNTDQAVLARLIQALNPRVSVHIHREGTAYDMVTCEGYEEVRARVTGSGRPRFFLRPGEGQLFLLRSALPAAYASDAEVDARYEALLSEFRRLVPRQVAGQFEDYQD